MSDVKISERAAGAPAPGSGSPSGPRVRRPTREEVRRRLLDAALDVFAEHGFDTANLDQVAAVAGLTKGAIYSNFASKDDLFYAMMAEQVLARVESIRRFLAANSPAVQRSPDLRDIGRLLTEAFAEQREWRMVFLDFWRRAVRDEAIREQFITHRQSLRNAIAAVVQQVIGGDPPIGNFTLDDVVTVALALSNGLAIEQYVDPSTVSGDLFGRVLVQLSGNVESVERSLDRFDSRSGLFDAGSTPEGVRT